MIEVRFTRSSVALPFETVITNLAGEERKITGNIVWDDDANDIDRPPQTWAEIEITDENFFEVAKHFNGEVSHGWRSKHYDDFISTEYVSNNAPLPFITSDRIEKPVTIGDRISVNADNAYNDRDTEMWWVELEETNVIGVTTLDEFLSAE